ncbi:MAG TPA: hypothetical protein VGF17_24535 [Phytomonospora sp.]
MSWWTYVTGTSGTESPKEMQTMTGIDGPNFSRWKAGHVPKVEMVAQFARAYRRPVLEAFVAAGFLTDEEAKARPAKTPDYSQLSSDELLRLVRSRMRDEGSGEDGAPNTEAGQAGAKITKIPTPPTMEDIEAGRAAAHRTRRHRRDENGGRQT